MWIHRKTQIKYAKSCWKKSLLTLVYLQKQLRQKFQVKKFLLQAWKNLCFYIESINRCWYFVDFFVQLFSSFSFSKWVLINCFSSFIFNVSWDKIQAILVLRIYWNLVFSTFHIIKLFIAKAFFEKITNTYVFSNQLWYILYIWTFSLDSWIFMLWFYPHCSRKHLQ